MAMTKEGLEAEYLKFMDFLNTNPSLGQFHAKVDGQALSSAMLYALFMKARNE